MFVHGKIYFILNQPSRPSNYPDEMWETYGCSNVKLIRINGYCEGLLLPKLKLSDYLYTDRQKKRTYKWLKLNTATYDTGNYNTWTGNVQYTVQNICKTSARHLDIWCSCTARKNHWIWLNPLDLVLWKPSSPRLQVADLHYKQRFRPILFTAQMEWSTHQLGLIR